MPAAQIKQLLRDLRSHNPDQQIDALIELIKMEAREAVPAIMPLLASSNVSVRAQDLVVIVTSAGTEEQALDIAHALVRNHRLRECAASNQAILRLWVTKKRGLLSYRCCAIRRRWCAPRQQKQ